MRFENLDIVITGGASGIGKAIAGQFAAMGNHIHILDINREGMDQALGEIAQARSRPDNHFTAHCCDITDFTAVKNAFSEMEGKGINPTVLINSAGIAYPGYVEQIPVSMFEKVMRVNFIGTVHTVKAILSFLLKQGEGYIVNVASLGALISIFGYTAYGASKFAVRGFSESLRAELKFKNIHVSLLCPPDTDTPQLREENKIKPPETFAVADSVKPMTAEQVATSLIKGMKKKKFLIIPGFEGKFVSLATRIFPGLADKIMEWKIRRYHLRQGLGICVGRSEKI